jgi:putative intracellular protease/amidase
MTQPEALLVLTSTSELGRTGRPTGAYLPEVLAAWTVLTQRGFRLGIASPSGGRPPLEAVDPDNPDHRNFLRGPQVRRALEQGLRTDEIGDLPQLVYLIGGHGAVFDLPGDLALTRLVEGVYRAGGVVAAVCHGPAGLLAAEVDGRPLVSERRVACFSNAEERAIGMSKVVPFLLADALAAQGARYDEGPAFMPHVVSDARLVTGQNPVSARLVAERAAECWQSLADPRPDVSVGARMGIGAS